ncbi:UNVERIFIED_CONTAM: hypothetical protein HHA_209540 [Hammondia hammondi]|eukprot:XP_008886994.1 hypothetical protein HHA_209540 [Hammondia hammondi]
MWLRRAGALSRRPSSPRIASWHVSHGGKGPPRDACRGKGDTGRRHQSVERRTQSSTCPRLSEEEVAQAVAGKQTPDNNGENLLKSMANGARLSRSVHRRSLPTSRRLITPQIPSALFEVPFSSSPPRPPSSVSHPHSFFCSLRLPPSRFSSSPSGPDFSESYLRIRSESFSSSSLSSPSPTFPSRLICSRLSADSVASPSGGLHTIRLSHTSSFAVPPGMFETPPGRPCGFSSSSASSLSPRLSPVLSPRVNTFGEHATSASRSSSEEEQQVSSPAPLNVGKGFCPLQVSQARMQLLQLASDATTLPLSFWESKGQSSTSSRAQAASNGTRSRDKKLEETSPIMERVEAIAREALGVVDGVTRSSASLFSQDVPGNRNGASDSSPTTRRDQKAAAAAAAAAALFLPELVALLPPFAVCMSGARLREEMSCSSFDSLPHFSSFLNLMVNLLHCDESWVSLTDDEFAASAHALQVLGCTDTWTAAAAAEALVRDGRLRRVSLRHLVAISASTLHASLQRNVHRPRDSLQGSYRWNASSSFSAPLAVIKRAGKAAQDRLLRERHALVESGMLVRAWQTAAALSRLSHAATVRAQTGFFLLLEKMKREQIEKETHAPLFGPLLPDEELAALPLALSAVHTPDERLLVWASEQVVVRLGGPSLTELSQGRDGGQVRSDRVVLANSEGDQVPSSSQGGTAGGVSLASSHSNSRTMRGGDSARRGRRKTGQERGGRWQEEERVMVAMLLRGMSLWERVGPAGMQQQALPVFAQAFLLPALPHLSPLSLLHLSEAATSPDLASSSAFPPTFSFSSFLPSAVNDSSLGSSDSRTEAKQRRRLLQERQDTLARVAAGSLGFLLLEHHRRVRFERRHLFRLLRVTRAFYQAQMLPRLQHLRQLLADKSGCLLEVEAALVKGVPLLYRDIALQLRLVSKSCTFFPLRGTFSSSVPSSSCPSSSPYFSHSSSSPSPSSSSSSSSTSSSSSPPISSSSLTSSFSFPASPSLFPASAPLAAAPQFFQGVAGEEGSACAARRMIEAARFRPADALSRCHAPPLAVSDLVQSLEDVAVLTDLLPPRRPLPVASLPHRPPGASESSEASASPRQFLLNLLQELLPLLALASAPPYGVEGGSSFVMTKRQISSVLTSCAALLLRLVGSWAQRAQLEQVARSLGLSTGLADREKECIECCRLLVLQIALLASDARVDSQAAAMALRALLACVHRVPSSLLSDSILVHPLPLGCPRPSLDSCEREIPSSTAACNSSPPTPSPDASSAFETASTILFPTISSLLFRLANVRLGESTRLSEISEANARGVHTPEFPKPSTRASPSSEETVDAGSFHRSKCSKESASWHIACPQVSERGGDNEEDTPNFSADNCVSLSPTKEGLRLNTVVPALAAAAWLDHQQTLLQNALPMALSNADDFCEQRQCSAEAKDWRKTPTVGRVTLADVISMARDYLENDSFLAALPECLDTVLAACEKQLPLLPHREIRLLELHLRAVKREGGGAETKGVLRVFTAIQNLLDKRWSTVKKSGE